jgi:hypothetical protein
MPKENSERIIDTPFGAARPARIGGGGGGGSGGGGSPTNLDALTDVTVSAPANGQVLVYSSGTGQWVNQAVLTGAPSPHGLSSSHHNGQLNWALINFAGSDLADLATRPHSALTGIGANDHHAQAHVLATGTALGADHTISGAVAGEVLRALSATTAAFDVLQHTDLGGITANQHHNQAHVLATDVGLGADHTIGGAGAGQVLRASSATAAQFMTLHHTDLDTILPDQHHARAHDIITGDASGQVHTIVGAKWSLPGATAVNTLGLIVPSFAPGAAEAVLRTDIYGGIQLDTDLLYVDGANNRIGINKIPSDAGIGSAALDIIAYNNADHSQRIKRKSGQTGRMWRIEDLDGSELIVLDSVGNLQSGKPGFVSGLTGWRITPQGNAEFNNIWARGELHATVFVKDEVHATGGTLLVASAGTLYDDAVINSTTVDEDVLVVYSTPAGQGVPLQVVTTATFDGNELHVTFVSNVININDPPSGPGFYFQPGDVVRSKTEVPTGVTDFWLEINSGTQYSGYAAYNVTKRSGSDGTLPKGSAVVSYGKEGDGRILLTSDLNYAPYIDVFTVGPQVWTGNPGSVLPRMRMGRLDGIGLPGISGVEQYGMIAGKDLSDANSGYLIASNLQFALYKIDIRLNNGANDTGLWTADGNLKIGSNVGALATTGFQVITTGARAGDVVIGNEATGNFLRWQQATGTLLVAGSLVVSDPGTTVTKSYVDTQDVNYDTLAQGYGGTAQTNAQNYADAHRIVGVSGTWTSAANLISWTGLSAMLANGGSRSIAAGNTGTMSARTYLYVNVTLGGTLTMSVTTSITTINQPGYVLIAVCDPGTPSASVSVVAGTTYISGSNIVTGSITANNIAALTITAAQIAGTTITAAKLAADVFTTVTDQATAIASGQRVIAVNGTFNTSGYQAVSWSGVTVAKANGVVIGVNNGGLNAGSSPPLTSRLYLHILEGDSGTTTMKWVNDIDDLPVNAIMIAVVTPGTTGTNGTERVSIVMVNGGVLISGDSISAGSIVAGNIKTGTITANEIAGLTITGAKIAGGTITSTKLDPAYVDGVNGAIDNAQNAATGYGNERRLVGVTGTWAVTGRNSFSWTQFSAYFASGLNLVVNAPSGGNYNGGSNGRRYFFVDVTATTPTLQNAASPSVLTHNQVLIAVFDPGTTTGGNQGTLQILAGTTWIAGDQIVTGSIVTAHLQSDSIVARHIVAGEITADKMKINSLEAMKGSFTLLATGDLTVNGILAMSSSGKIYSGLKATAANNTPGFFLGYDGGQYKFTVGDASNFIKWDGARITINTDYSINLGVDGTGQVLRVTNSATGHIGVLDYESAAPDTFRFQTPLIADSFAAGSYLRGSNLQLVGIGANPQEMIRFGYGESLQRVLTFDSATGLLAYDDDFSANGSLFGTTLFNMSNTFHIVGSRTPDHLAGGAAGDICWDEDYLYIYNGNRWHRIQHLSW